MESIIQYLDVIIVSLITGISGYIISSLNYRRAENKEEKERDRKHLDEYNEALAEYEIVYKNIIETYIH